MPAPGEFAVLRRGSPGKPAAVASTLSGSDAEPNNVPKDLATPLTQNTFDPRGIVRRLADAYRPAEDTFLQVGERLAEAAGELSNLQFAFGALLKELTENDAVRSVVAVKDSFGETLGERPVARTNELSRLIGLAPDLDRRLVALRKVVAEVGTLSLNARIQAAQVRGSTDEFTVFTMEVARLSAMARDRLAQIGARLKDLTDAVHAAQAVASAFAREGAAELGRIRERVETGAAILSNHQKGIARKVEELGRRSNEIGEQIDAIIRSLQIGDITSQRIEHIRSAIACAAEALDGSQAAQNRALGAVCRLQAAQLERTVADLDASVAALVQSLRALARASDDLGREVGAAMTGDSGDTSFMAELGEHLRRAQALLQEYEGTRQRTQEVVAAVSDGFGEMAHEIEAIDAIDADLRLVALNATLKCARLGSAGRALAVVAQELRAESQRAESGARELSASVAEAIELAAVLNDERGRREACKIGEVQAQVARTIDGIAAFAAQVDASIGQIHEGCRRVAGMLRETASSVELDATLIPSLREIAAELRCHADGADPDAIGKADLPDHVLAALTRSYTMESERYVHMVVFGELSGSLPQPDLQADRPSSANNDIDDVFFD